MCAIVAYWLEHRAPVPEGEGSIPLSVTHYSLFIKARRDRNLPTYLPPANCEELGKLYFALKSFEITLLLDAIEPGRLTYLQTILSVHIYRRGHARTSWWRH